MRGATTAVVDSTTASTGRIASMTSPAGVVQLSGVAKVRVMSGEREGLEKEELEAV